MSQNYEITCGRCSAKVEHECDPQGLQEVAVDLFAWRPEDGFPKALKKGNPFCDGTEDDPTTPFLTESFLYPLLGKEDARSLMARIHALFYAMGLNPRAIELRAWELVDQAKRKKEDEKKRQEEARARWFDMMLPLHQDRDLGGKFIVCDYRSFYAFDTNVAACERAACLAPTAKRKTRKKGLDKPILDSGKFILVRCTRCRRLHTSPKAQFEGWQSEKPYRVREGSRITPRALIQAECLRDVVQENSKI